MKRNLARKDTGRQKKIMKNWIDILVRQQGEFMNVELNIEKILSIEEKDLICSGTVWKFMVMLTQIQLNSE